MSTFETIVLIMKTLWLNPVATRSKAWVWGHSLAGNAVLNSAAHGCLCVVCCQVEVCASGWSLIQRSTTECGVSECDCEALIRRRFWPTRGFCAIGEIKTLLQFDIIRQALLGLVISKINSRRISDLPQSILVPDRVSQNSQWASLLPVALP